MEKDYNTMHWPSVKIFFCLKAIDFALESGLKFWPVYMKSMLCSTSQFIKIFNKCYRNGENYHDSSLKRDTRKTMEKEYNAMKKSRIEHVK